MKAGTTKNGRDNPSYVALLAAEAKRAYSAFRTATGGKDHRNLPLPAWDDLPAHIREGWHAAIDAVITGQVTH